MCRFFSCFSKESKENSVIKPSERIDSQLNKNYNRRKKYERNKENSASEKEKRQELKDKYGEFSTAKNLKR